MSLFPISPDFIFFVYEGRKPLPTTTAAAEVEEQEAMVSKSINKTPTKSVKDRRNRRRKKSPLKNFSNASSIVVASINKSFFSCQRRLVKIFTKLAKISTPIHRKKGFQLLKKCKIEDEEEAAAAEIAKNQICRSLFHSNGLPPLSCPEKKTVFLDLDETLIHSKPDPPPERYDFVVRPRIEGEFIDFYVLKRPGVEELLDAIGEKFEIVVFTAGIKEYASLVLDKIDPKGLISHRLYRDSCKEMEGKFVKDLSEMGRDLSRVVIVDDNPNAYVFQPENALPVRPFIDDLQDQELQRVIRFFEFSDCFEDMRDAVKNYLSYATANQNS
ncbi:carboxy-terminal domain RNA polymerase II polypeptide A small phosphatase 2-like [Telopea speciosissima]|uniref:carboxy-terminal domain RNA polymerase II polypeptide A small phosphatase 2-like n=1 Tax=Telopea speciosissima TaxID=54955 RepID=UPI001CC6A4C1|nr:carboxy-terminal domain RNA polymerase II polypeptide A small phosphatase 2-like [Telopea speciosissima]